MLRDELDREIVGARSSTRGSANASATSTNCAQRGGPRERHQRGVAPVRAPQRQRALRDRDEQREDQREVAELRNHFASFSVGIDIDLCFRAASIAAAASGGM